jgi:ethanolamine utilization protein EutA
MPQDMLSVGIDVGTSTTQLVFSRLRMADRSAFFSVPKVDIVSRDIVYRGAVHETPLVPHSALIDTEALVKIISAEFSRAGFTQADTGAVIITGESARKENARAVLESLSGRAGDFVVSTAGPGLEAIIAGQGSGAAEWSRRNLAAAVNLDIGGGTTNIAVFDNGEVKASGSYDIGGRLVRVKDGVITSVSGAAREAAHWKGLSALEAGMPADEPLLYGLCEAFAEILEMALGLRPAESILEKMCTPGAGDFVVPPALDGLFLSGGVADFVYEGQRSAGVQDIFAYGDIGPLLGRAIRKSALCGKAPLRRGAETIRATVIGAGSCTVNLSGSTIFYEGDVFPQKNLPVLRLSPEEEAACYQGAADIPADRLRWFLAQHDAAAAAVAIKGEANPDYKKIRNAARVFAVLGDEVLAEGLPLIILSESDTAKALGQETSAQLKKKRPVAALDCIAAAEHTFIDIGLPLAGGAAVPLVVKTLIFG